MRIRLPKNTLARREAAEGLLGISPWLIGFLLFTAGPFVVSIVLSMTDWRIMIAPKFVGLQNYVQILTNDPNFWQSIRVTFTYVALALPLGLFAGLGLSLLLNQKVPGARAFGTLFYLPAVLSGVSVALMWMWLLNPDYGVVNTLLGLVGIQGPNWFWDPDWALPSVVLMSLWRVGGSAIIYLAGLQNISPHLYEAAEIDGAGRLAKLRHITIPMLTPTIFFQLVMELIDAFQVFTVIYVI
ncbi:MAG TPA: sugar ABC transporter permease, partial [Thermoflexales bacterium]|nr:sugar ABC transporter permease [Thermoflexales bacterium]